MSFFNGVEQNGKKQVWVKWSKVLASKENGGLGVSSFYALNRALLFKWVWHFRTQPSSIWTQVIQGIHGVEGKLGKQVNNHHPSLWLDIVKEVHNLQNQGIDLMGYILKKLGNGEDTLFWEDSWRGDSTFKSIYPRLYALETNKNVSIASKLSQPNLAASFRRAPRGGLEDYQFSQLLLNMEEVSCTNVKDRWLWALTGCGDFSVASIRKSLDNHFLPVAASKTRWIREVPIEVNILAWKVRMDGLPRLNISKRGMDIQSILSPTCDKEVESTSHIFFSCYLAHDIFCKILRWWDIYVMEISSYEEWIDWLSNIRLHSKHKKLFKGVCYVMWWFILNFQNKFIFGSVRPLKEIIFDEVVARLYLWCNNRCNFSFN
ncbi:RNA-directed DNA polymerase, eukaryota, reverse transcriptase zinc-binding domain protein [Tanacetum coccineum]